jgi:hypothetical protein
MYLSFGFLKQKAPPVVETTVHDDAHLQAGNVEKVACLAQAKHNGKQTGHSSDGMFPVMLLFSFNPPGCPLVIGIFWSQMTNPWSQIVAKTPSNVAPGIMN